MMLSHDDLWSIVCELDGLVHSMHYELTTEQREKYNAVRKKMGWAMVRVPDYSGSPGNMS